MDPRLQKLSTRIRKALARLGVETWEQARALTDDQLMAQKGFGWGCLIEFHDWLESAPSPHRLTKPGPVAPKVTGDIPVRTDTSPAIRIQVHGITFSIRKDQFHLVITASHDVAIAGQSDREIRIRRNPK